MSAADLEEVQVEEVDEYPRTQPMSPPVDTVVLPSIRYAEPEDEVPPAPVSARNKGLPASISSQRVSSAPAPLEPALLTVRVTNPQKVGLGGASYVIYEVATKTNMAQFSAADFSRKRRYNDFLWLYEQLFAENKACIIPPIPDKAVVLQSIQGRFSPEFMEARRRELEKFLGMVASHPLLSRSRTFSLFLEAADEVLNEQKVKQAKDQQQQQHATDQATGAAGSGIGSVFTSIFGNSGLATLTAATTTEVDPWFDNKRGYFLSLETQLLAVSKAQHQIIAKYKEVATAYTELGDAMSMFSCCEADHDKWVSGALSHGGQTVERLGSLFGKLATPSDDGYEEVVFFEEVVKDYLRLIGAVKLMLKNRTDTLTTLQAAEHQLKLKRDKFEKGNSRKLESPEFDEAKRRVDESAAALLEMSRGCRTEIERFEQLQSQEMRRAINLLVKNHMDSSAVANDEWKSLVKCLQNGPERNAQDN